MNVTVIWPAWQLRLGKSLLAVARRATARQKAASSHGLICRFRFRTETARLTGIPDATLSDWIRGKRGVSSPDLPKLRNEKGKNLSDHFEEIALESCRVARGKLADTSDDISFSQLMTRRWHCHR